MTITKMVVVPTSFQPYAPRDESKSLVITVSKGTVDYTAYPLIGDLNNNGEVDFDDETLLRNAIRQSSTDALYDLNGDGIIDITDTIDLVARIGSEINFFDFYTVTGEKLAIPSRSFLDNRTFAYAGTQQKIMVVAKDVNGVSGFEADLSDIGDVWYKNRPAKRSLLAKDEGLDVGNADKKRLVQEAIIEIIDEPNPYLLGGLSL